MILFAQPYSLNKNIAEEYNYYMSTLPDDNDWYCFTDGDSKFTTDNYGHHLADIINKNPGAWLFTSMTNRIGNKEQCVEGMWGSEDMRIHRLKGRELQKKYAHSCTDITNSELLGGVLILIQKKAWLKAGKFTGNGILGVDNNIHISVKKAGGKIYLMKGFYVYHWYRGGNRFNKQHLLK